MKKILSILACFCFLLVGGIVLTACGEPKLTGIEIDESTHTTFVEGNTFTKESLKINGVYDNKSKKALEEKEYDKVTASAVKDQTTVTLGQEFPEAGDYTVTVSYEFDKNTTFTKEYVVTVNLKQEGGVALVSSEEELKIALEHYESAKLTGDVVLSDTFAVNKEFTLDLDTHTIKNEKDIYTDVEDHSQDKWSLISVKEGGKLTLKGTTGEVVAKENDCFAVDVDGGELTIDGGKYSGNGHTIYVFKGICTINGGEFDIQTEDKTFVLNCLDANYQNKTAKIIVKGGTFKGFNPENNKAESVNGGIDYLADGYYVEDSQSTYTVKKYEDEKAHVRTEAGLREALTAPKTQTVVLDKNISFNTSMIQLDSVNSNITLDLNGHTLSTDSKIVICSGATLTIKDTQQTGKIVSTNQTVALFLVGAQPFFEDEDRAGHLVIESGEFESVAEVVLVSNGTAEIKGGKFNSTNSNHWALNIYDNAKAIDRTKIEVTGGEFTEFNPETPNTNDKSTYVKQGYKAQQKGGEGNVYEVVAEEE